MSEIKIENKVYYLPNTWDEMSPRQFVHVIAHFLNSKEVRTFKLKALFSLLNFQLPNKPTHHREGITLYTIKANKKDVFLLSAQQLADMIPLLNFMFDVDEQGEISDYILCGRTINPIPSFKSNSIRYYGPDDRFFNCSFHEFIEAEVHYLCFLKDRSASHILNLVASLYRPQDPNYNPTHYEYKGDRREAYNEHLISYRANKFDKVSPHTLFSIFYWFQGCRQFLTWQFPHVFSPGDSKPKSPFGMMAVVDALAQNDVTKTELILKGSLYSIMLRLEQSAITKIEMEQRMSKK